MCDNVLEADVKGRISVRGEGVSVLAHNVLWSAILVSNCILDLDMALLVTIAINCTRKYRYVHACSAVAHLLWSHQRSL